MEDRQIVELYWARDEQAIAETEEKYGQYCYAIARNILHSHEDSAECVNDTWMAAWNAIPPHRPEILSSFLRKITRRLALRKWRARNAEKRGGGIPEMSLTELEECIPSGGGPEEQVETDMLTEVLNTFLETLPLTERRVFLRRYWYFDSVNEIASCFGFSEGKVKMMLMRTRKKLRVRLQEEEIWI